MQTIYRGNKAFQQFDFKTLSLSSPIRVGNGNYFMKYKANEQSLYVQPPQCLTKQGIINVSKKYYIDLLFTNDDVDFIQWMEKLEETSVQYIYQNRAKWFDGDMEKEDIENYFSSPFRIFRSGKYYILRVGISNTLGVPGVKAYDSDQNEVSIDEINDTTQIMCILEIKGVKCGTRNFQIELETKQLLIVKPSNPFDKCLFNLNDSVSSSQTKSPEPVTIPVKEEIEDADQSNNDVILETVDEPVVEDIVSNPPLNEEIPEVPLDISYNLGITSETGYMDEPDTQEATDLENVSTSLENMKNEQDLGEQLEIMKEPFDIQSNEM